MQVLCDGEPEIGMHDPPSMTEHRGHAMGTQPASRKRAFKATKGPPEPALMNVGQPQTITNEFGLHMRA